MAELTCPTMTEPVPPTPAAAPVALPLAIERAARWYGLLAVTGWVTLVLGLELALATVGLQLGGQPALAKALALPGAAMLLAAAALMAAVLLTAARRRVWEAADAALVTRQQRHAALAARAADAPATQALFSGGDDPDLLVRAEGQRALRLAGWPQALVGLPLVVIAAALAIWTLSTLGRSPGDVALVPGGFAVGIALLIAAFPVLVVERRLSLAAASALLPAQVELPEAAGLARLLRLLVWTLVVCGAAEVARSLGAGTLVGWVLLMLAILLVVIACEVALRVAAAPFLPAAGLAEARGLADSAIAGLVLPRLGAGGGGGTELKERFGIDLSQSWALGFVRRASGPLFLVLLLGAWLLSGVTALSLQERGVYERLGAPVAVLKSGLHVHLPYPFGIVRRLDSGAVRELAIGLQSDAAQPAAPLPARLMADATDTRTFDRVWRLDHAADALYIVPGDGGDATARAAQVLNSDVRVFYRIGLDDAAARASLYHLTRPEDSVRLVARRHLARVFATRPLMAAIGEDRSQLGAAVRAAVQADLDATSSGLEILAVTIDSIHPPAKAAAAYHGVQEAGIISERNVADARRNAIGDRSDKAIEASNIRANGVWKAANLLSVARVDATLFAGDAAAWQLAPEALALERWLHVLTKGLSSGTIDIIDHRLRLIDGPVLDLRRFAAPGDTGE